MPHEDARDAPPLPKPARRRAAARGEGPSLRARTIAASAVLAVVLLLVLADAFGEALFGVDIELPKSAYPLVGSVMFFWFGIKISDWVHFRIGPEKDEDK